MESWPDRLSTEPNGDAEQKPRKKGAKTEAHAVMRKKGYDHAESRRG
jgi:hypothetical protein